MFVYFFFFQAEDGIRDLTVTGVQTCALPILLKFLRNDVAKNAAFLLLEVITSGSQLIEHATRHESGGSELGGWMFEFLPSTGSVNFEDADVLQASVALRGLNSMGNQ